MSTKSIPKTPDTWNKSTVKAYATRLAHSQGIKTWGTWTLADVRLETEDDPVVREYWVKSRAGVSPTMVVEFGYRRGFPWESGMVSWMVRLETTGESVAYSIR